VDSVSGIVDCRPTVEPLTLVPAGRSEIDRPAASAPNDAVRRKEAINGTGMDS
jgi:hypothetical protein